MMDIQQILADLPEKMRNALVEFDGFANDAIKEFVKTVEAAEPPPIIYHYTDDAGLKGILESGTLRLTDIHNLNDPSELKHGFFSAIEIVKSLLQQANSLRQRFVNRFEDFGINGGIQETTHCFVLCFSSDGDDLGQWRSYADNGRGYALGFDTKSIERAFEKTATDHGGSNNTFLVTYDNEELFKLQTTMTSKLEYLISLAFENEQKKSDN
jgi:hypothetical protein